MKKLLAPLLLSLAIAACGGGGGSDAPSKASAFNPISPANAAPATAQSGVIVQMFGDSTTAGSQTLNGRSYQTAMNEPAHVQAALRQWFNRTDIAVDNQGVGGTEASQLLNGTDGVHPPFDQVMAQSPAKIVVLNFALNDSYYANPSVNPPAGVQRESTNDYWGILSQLCQTIRNHGKICVFEEPNPINGVQDTNAPIYSYVFTLRQVAAQLGAPLIKQWDGFMGLPGWLGWLSEDGVHPKDEGYAWKAWNSFNTIFPLVAQSL